MDAQELADGVKELDELSRVDYRESLAEVMADSLDQEVLARVGRLIGVSLKKPFAEPESLESPSPYSRAYRAWQLQPPRFETPEIANTWQYQTLEAIRREDEPRFQSVQELALEAHYETGFFSYLARSVQKYLCRDPDLRKRIEDNVAEAKASGVNLKLLTPEQVVQAGGVALASLLVTSVPVLGLVGAPVIAGFVLLLYGIGLDAFCHWVKESDLSRDRA